MKFLTHPLIIVALLGSAALLFAGAGCTGPSQAAAAGIGAAAVIKQDAPKAVPYVETVAASVRSIAGTQAPTPDKVQATATTWTAKLPITDAEKARLVSAVTTRYQAVYPRLEKAQNALDQLEDFAAGLEAGGI